MDPKEPLSYSRLGPMDPRQVRYELAEELASPAAQAEEPPRAQRRARPRRVRQRRVRGEVSP